MTATRIVLLPGLHGTTKLFGRFIATAPPNVSITAIPLPAEPLTYLELADRLAGALTDGKPVIHLLLQANPVGAWKAIVEFLKSLQAA